MDGWPRRKRLQEIFINIRAQSDALTEGRQENVNTIIDRIDSLTAAVVPVRSSMQLQCSAALQQSRRMEQIILDGMRLDRWITSQEEAVLVHLRIFCAEIIGILSDTLDDMRGISRSGLMH